MKMIFLALLLALLAPISARAATAFEFRTPQSNAVQGTLDTTGNVVFIGSGTFSGAGGLTVTYGATISTLTATAGANLATVSGSVGIGTSSPATKLHMSSGTLTIDGSGTGAIQVSAGHQIIVGTNGNGGTGTALEVDESNSGALTHFRNSTTGGLFRTLNGAGVEQGIFVDAGNDGTDTNSSLRITNQGAFKLLWLSNSGKLGLGTESPASKFHCSTCAVIIDGTGAALTVGTSYFFLNSGIASFKSQSGAKAFFQDAQVVPMDVWTQEFLANTTANGTGYNNQNTYIATSSGSLVARGDGVYSGECAIGFSRQLETQWIEVTRNGAPGVGDTIAHGQFWSQNTSVVYHPIPWSAKLVDGDLIQCWVFIDGGVGNETMNGNQRTYLSAKKDQ